MHALGHAEETEAAPGLAVDPDPVIGDLDRDRVVRPRRQDGDRHAFRTTVADGIAQCLLDDAIDRGLDELAQPDAARRYVEAVLDLGAALAPELDEAGERVAKAELGETGRAQPSQHGPHLALH